MHIGLVIQKSHGKGEDRFTRFGVREPMKSQIICRSFDQPLEMIYLTELKLFLDSGGHYILGTDDHGQSRKVYLNTVERWTDLKDTFVITDASKKFITTKSSFEQALDYINIRALSYRIFQDDIEIKLEPDAFNIYYTYHESSLESSYKLYELKLNVSHQQVLTELQLLSQKLDKSFYRSELKNDRDDVSLTIHYGNTFYKKYVAVPFRMRLCST
jgi:hypothetical protein